MAKTIDLNARYLALLGFVRGVAEEEMDIDGDDIREDDDCPSSEDMCAAHNENIETARTLMNSMGVRYKKRSIG